MRQEKSSDSSETPLVKETPLEVEKELAILSCWILYLNLRYFEPIFFFLLGSPGLHAVALT